jgi:4-amino-4-deoxy-L-arabinose transferase-like glycosyltransferase
MQGPAPGDHMARHGLVAGRALLIILAAIVLVRLVSLGAYPLLDKSEARYAYIGELMVQSGNWITPFIDHDVPFWAKPVLSTWLTALSLIVFGFNAFAARFSSFLIFLDAGWLVFELGTRARDREFGLAAACVFASTALAFYLGGTVMTDPALMLGVTLTMAGYWRCVAGPAAHSRLWGYLFFLGVAIGALAKGPIGVLLPGMSIVAWATHQRRWSDSWRRLPWLTGTLLAVVLVVPWYLAAEHRTPGFLRYFIVGEHFERFVVPGWKGDLYGSGRAHAIGSIWLFGLVCMLPWSGMLIGLLFRKTARQQLFRKSVFNDPWLSYLIYWTLAPLLLFTFARNVLMSYVATSVPAFALLTVHAMWRSRKEADRYGFVIAAALVPVLMLGALIVALANPGARFLPTQAGIVATYKKLNAGQPSDLVYLFDKPYSADFYSGGAAKIAGGNEQAAKALNDGASFFAVSRRSYLKMSADLRSRLETVAELNNTILLRRR